MPRAVNQLEEAIDDTAETDKWVHGTGDTIPALRSEGFDFKSEAAGRVLAGISARGDVELLRGLIRAGAPTDVRPLSLFGGIVALRAAVLNENPEVLRELIAAGASKEDSCEKREALLMARRTGRTDLVDLLVKYGARGDGPASSSQSARGVCL